MRRRTVFTNSTGKVRIIKHCFYYAIMQHINNIFDTNMSEPEIFLYFGGYDFSVQRNENEFYENVSIKGNIIDTEHFSSFTNIKLDILNFNDTDKATNFIIDKVSLKKNQLGIVNSYYLSFDAVNYKKNNGSHIIIIEKYDEHTKSFIASDQRYTQEHITLNDLVVALTSNNNTDVELINLLYDERPDVQKIRGNIPIILNKNAEKNVSNCTKEFGKLKALLEQMNNSDAFYRSLSFYELMRSIKSVDGPISSKNYLIKSEYINNPLLIELLEKANRKWERLCLDLYKAHSTDEPLHFKDSIEVLEELEYSFHDAMISYL